jgi:hypothetical protein
MGVHQFNKGEMVLFPTPYAEEELNPLVVTTQRVIQVNKEKKSQLEVGKITFVGKTHVRPFLLIGVFLIVAALPVFGWAAWNFWKIHDVPSFTEQPPDVEDPGYMDPGIERIVWIAVGAAALAVAAGGVLLGRKKHFFVLCRGGKKRVMRLRVQDPTQQTVVMMTLQGVIQSAKTQEAAAKANAAAAAAAAPPAPKKT